MTRVIAPVLGSRVIRAVVGISVFDALARATIDSESGCGDFWEFEQGSMPPARALSLEVKPRRR